MSLDWLEDIEVKASRLAECVGTISTAWHVFVDSLRISEGGSSLPTLKQTKDIEGGMFHLLVLKQREGTEKVADTGRVGIELSNLKAFLPNN